MTQFLHPLYGEYMQDTAVSQSVPLPPGVYAGLNPTIAGGGGASGWTVSLNPDADGISYWRTPGSASAGRFVIQETAAVQLPIAPPDATYTRIDLLVGIHKWVAGPIDPSTLEPTGAYTSPQQATYTVVQGTPAATPVAPTVADPYDGTGNRAVILAQVTVPITGTPTVIAYPATDLRLLGMRTVIQEVINARSTYPDLPTRLNAMAASVASITQINAVAFTGTTATTSSATTFATVPLTTTARYGTAVQDPVNNTIPLAQPGLYEIEAFHKVEGSAFGVVCVALRVWLVRTGASPLLLDQQLDTNSDEITEVAYAMVYVDPSWTNVAVYFERAGNPIGTLRGSVKFLGDPNALQAISISTGDTILQASSNQTYPDSATIPLVAYSAVGAVTWQVVSAGGLNGTTSPAATIVNGNQLQIAWATAPTYPDVHQVELQVTDSASTPRTATKTITITLNAAAPLVVTTAATLNYTAYAYPYAVSLQAMASGGSPPYTFSIVTADTNLPGAAISGTTVTGSPTAAGTYTVGILCTDAAAVQVEEHISITVTTWLGGGGGGTGCVPAGTPLSMGDGTTIPIETAMVGMSAMAFDDFTGEPVEATITATWIHEDRELYRLQTTRGELVCSHDHRLYSRAHDAWIPARSLQAADITFWLLEGMLVEAKVLECVPTGERATVYHLTLDHGHVYVAGGVPAHNIIKSPI